MSPQAVLMAAVLAVTSAGSSHAVSPAAHAPPPATRTPAPAPAPVPMLDPYSIYDRAVEYVRSQDYPRYIAFITTARAQVRGGRWLVEQFQSTLFTPNDIVGTASRPVSSTNREPSPYGFSLFPGWGRPHGNIDEPFGVPYISPAYNFGLTHAAPLHEIVPTPSSEKSLGRVLTVGRDYDVTLSGVDTFHGHSVYSLELRPLGSPHVFRLRELLVDTRTFVIWGLTTDGVFENGLAANQTWYVVFQLVDGRWYISYERCYDHFHSGGALGMGGFHYEYVSYSFTDFTYPKETDDSVFTQGLVDSQAVQM